MRKFILISTYNRILESLPSEKRKKLWRILALILITSIIDIAGLAVFIPIISAVAEPELLNKGFLQVLNNWLPGWDNRAFLLLLFFTGFLFMVFRTLFVLYSQQLQSKFCFEIAEFIGEKTFEYYLSSDFETVTKQDSAKIIRELTQSPQHFSRFLVLPVLLITAEIVVIALITLGIAFYNIEVLLLVCGTIFPVVFLFQFLVKRKLQTYGERQHEHTPKLYSNSNRGIYGMVDVRLRNKGERLIDDYKSVLRALNAINIKTNVLAMIPAKLFELVTVLGLLIIFVYAAYISGNPSQILPLITVYAAAGYRLIPSLTKIMPSLMQLEQYSYLFNVYRPVFENKYRWFSNSTSQRTPVFFEEEILFHNIRFAFRKNEQPVLTDITLKIKKGEIIGLIGKSGSGKSTLINLLIGFYKPDSGEIRIDGKLLESNQAISWMNEISYVQQSPYLERGSLAANIAFLEQDIDHDRLNKSIIAASLDGFVNGRDPYQIQIEEMGKNLSGGQKQRVIIARALYHNSSLIILDEATSALDNETEEAINQTIEQLRGSGITILIIAHRFSTLKHTDRIVRLEGGRIKEVLQYNSLLH
ncbi:ABC transporter ATP-binding protein [Flavihumibacter cheonanensis]|uniref:ABC transporter ATP-binding protein n=1 Tax=Flavihumibacter cheonanensis TaxID=1442385 RepID=UPI001EF7D366|nr:ABC transporter ATP-binding protein [Flavihumibacter cheonanensis]MCG7753917.1 ABC transporter ATP-binding protein/permease [Flavihumibacter cheonanensis]